MRLPTGTSRRAQAVAAALVCLGLLLGACSSDGGISGTGTGEDFVGANPSEPSDQALPAPSPGASPVEQTPRQSFENAVPAYAGFTPYLRGVNLSSRAVIVSVDGAGGLALAPALADGVASADAVGLEVVSAGTDEIAVTVDGAAAPSASIDVQRLAPGTLTTLLVQDAADGGLAVTPLVTLATPETEGTALVRIAYAAAPDDATAFAGSLSLTPGAGGAPLRFPASDLAPVASGYLELVPGDYALSADGDTATLPVSVEAGEVLTLVFTAPAGDDDPGLFRRIVDSELR